MSGGFAVDLTVLISFLTGGVAFVVFAVWMFYNSGEEAQINKSVEQCPYCTYVFESEAGMDRCPRCRSFLADLKERES